ncbi:type II secretion system F family protein [Cellulomonas timonensis]|uniref:type II secretion system F family protein n=1 Tax=Cellulomonas timonensis TaxID=1689271 RepID=UPI000A9FD2B4|nr:type II secretion system F family protein [Cellulomonas timonensis]
METGAAVAALLGLAAVCWRAPPSRRLRGIARGAAAGGRPRARAHAGRPRGRGADVARADPVDVVLVLELVEVAVAAGVAVPRALQAVGEAVGGVEGDALVHASAALVLGASWEAAWARAPERLGAVAVCLRPAWLAGAAPGGALRAQAATLRRGRLRHAREAAGRMGVHLVLPLGLCFLPAFVLLGLVPVMLSLADGLLG